MQLVLDSPLTCLVMVGLVVIWALLNNVRPVVRVVDDPPLLLAVLARVVTLPSLLSPRIVNVKRPRLLVGTLALFLASNGIRSKEDVAEMVILVAIRPRVLIKLREAVQPPC